MFDFSAIYQQIIRDYRHEEVFSEGVNEYV